MNTAITSDRKRMTRREREKAASRSAAWREAHKNRPDVRAVDKALSESIAVYAATLPKEEGAALLKRLIGLSATGLEYRSYDHGISSEQVARRLKAWMTGALTSGSVKTAVMRADIKAARDAENAKSTDTLVTSSYGTTEITAA